LRAWSLRPITTPAAPISSSTASLGSDTEVAPPDDDDEEDGIPPDEDDDGAPPDEDDDVE